MDPSMARGLAEALAPCLALLSMGAVPALIIFVVKHFKLKERELELEAELHGREAQARIQALETRQAAVESALQALASALMQRTGTESRLESFAEPPATVAPELPEEQRRGLAAVKSPSR